jgi:hypothetical protein
MPTETFMCEGLDWIHVAQDKDRSYERGSVLSAYHKMLRISRLA